MATYNQIGKVIFAIFLCLSNRCAKALTYVIKTKGIIITDREICVNKINK